MLGQTGHAGRAAATRGDGCGMVGFHGADVVGMEDPDAVDEVRASMGPVDSLSEDCLVPNPL